MYPVYGMKIKQAVRVLEHFHDDYLSNALIGYCPVDEHESANTYDEVCEAFRKAEPYPVWEGGSDTSMYAVFGTGVEGNYAFRTVHDHLHFIHQKEFNVTDEAALAFEHVSAFTRWAWQKEVMADVTAVARHALLIDTLGQTAVFSLTEGSFVYDQVDFLVNVLCASDAPTFLTGCLEQKMMPNGALSFFIVGAMNGGLDDWINSCNSYNPNI